MSIEDVIILPIWLKESQRVITDNSIEFQYVDKKPIQIVLRQGKYKFEAYGASGGTDTGHDTTAKLIDGTGCIEQSIVDDFGGNSNCNLLSSTSGAGGYISGNISFTFPVKLFLHIGGQGTFGPQIQQGGYNGGGSTIFHQTLYAGSGGGATDFRLFSDTLYHRILVAGGGGGSDNNDQGQFLKNDDGSGGAGGIPSQGAWSDGTYLSSLETNSTYGFAFGQGQKGTSSLSEGSGAGGGFFGGFSSGYSNAGAGGGSSFALTPTIPIPTGNIETKNEDGDVLSAKKYAFSHDSPFLFYDVKNATGINVGNGRARITLIKKYPPLPIHSCHSLVSQNVLSYLLTGLFISSN